jgi:hypothetical protein
MPASCLAAARHTRSFNNAALKMQNERWCKKFLSYDAPANVVAVSLSEWSSYHNSLQMTLRLPGGLAIMGHIFKIIRE